MALLEVSSLGFTYPKKPDFNKRSTSFSLSEIDFTLDSGEIALLYGRSGCGKSTLLRLFKPELSPYGEKSGEIRLSSQPIGQLDSRFTAAAIGYVGQDPDAQPVTEDVLSELAYLPQNLGFSPEHIRRKIAEISAFFGLEQLCRKNIYELSGGQKQLVNLAAVMVCEPKILLLDEPTAQLDPLSAEQFRRNILRVREQLGTAVVICEHSAEHIYPHCDKVVYLENGRQIFCLPPDKAAEKLKSTPLFSGLPCTVQLSSALETDPLTLSQAQNLVRERFEPQNPTASAAASENYAITAENVFFRYTRHGKDVLSGLSFKAASGRITAVCGANGTGKSTLLRLISGALKSQEGSIKICGRRISSYKNGSLYKKMLALLPQRPSDIMLHETVFDDLLYDPDGEKRSEESVFAVTESLGLDRSLLYSHPFDLSGGELQRAAIAKLLLLEPKILLLDEPEKGLDIHAKIQLCRILKQLSAQGKTVVFITHDLDFAAQTADSIALLFGGTVAAQQPTVEFLKSGGLYTTAAARISGEVFPDAVTSDRLIEKCLNTLPKGECKRYAD